MISSENGVNEFFDLVRATSIIGRLNVHRIPFRTRTLVQDEGPRVAWRDEGAAYGNSPLKLTAVTGLEPFEVGALIVSTMELLRDASLNAELQIRDQLVKALAVAFDSAFIDPANSGSAGVKPAAVTSSASGDSPAPGENLFKWADSFAGGPENAVILLNPWQAARLSSAARPNIGANGGTWAGFPVITSTSVPEGQMVLLDPARIAVAMGNAEIRVSTQGTVEMADSSSMNVTSPTAANQTSLWSTNSWRSSGQSQLTGAWSVLTLLLCMTCRA